MSILIGINIDLLLPRCIVRFGDGQLQLPVYTLNIYQSLGVGILLVGICSQILGWSQRYLRGSRLLLIFAQILHDIDNFPIRRCGWGDFPEGILDFLFYFLSLITKMIIYFTRCYLWGHTHILGWVVEVVISWLLQLLRNQHDKHFLLGLIQFVFLPACVQRRTS